MADIPGRLQVGTSFDQAMPMINDALDSIDAENRTKIIRVAGIPALLFGYQQAGFNGQDYGLKISRINPTTGSYYDVTTATAEQLAFNSGSNTELLYNDSIATLLFGYQAGGFGGSGKDFGLKIAKTGFDVRTATDAQLAFSSGKSYLVESDSILVNVPYTPGSLSTATSFPHGQSSTPWVVASVYNPLEALGYTNTWYQLPWGVYVGTLGGDMGAEVTIQISVDSTNINFIVRDSENGGPWATSYPVRYRIVQSTL